MNIFYKKIILLLILGTSISMFSQEVLTKKIEKTFEMTNVGELHVENKYGNITINGWEKNSIEIVIDVKVRNKKEENAKNLLDRINANFRTANDYVNVVSEISEKNPSFFSKYFNKVNPFKFDKSNVEINYTIYLPKNAEIDIANKFGDVVIENWTGKLKAIIDHGDLWINDQIASAKIDMKFGKLRTKSLTYGNITLKNGDIDIEESQSLLLNTSGTTIEIGEVTNLELVSSKDKINIEHVNNIQGKLKFSNVNIISVEKIIDLTMKVVDFKVSKINQSNAFVTINQESSDININITGLSFDFEATLEQGLLRVPKTFTNIKTTVVDKGDRIRKINASYKKPYASGNFSFVGKKGVIVLKESNTSISTVQK